MTTMHSMTDKLARFAFYCLILAAPACGGGGGGEGRSLFFVTGEGRWKQVWVTEWATRPGGVKEKDWQELDEPGRVRFQGRITLPDGRSHLDRTTLTKLPSGDVRQVIEHSTDDGAAWEADFDAIYRARK